HPVEDALVCRFIHQSPRPGNGHVVGRGFIEAISEELSQTQRVRHSPRDPTFAVYALEKAQQHHPEIHSGCQRWPALLLGVKTLALFLAKRVEFGGLQWLVMS